MKSSENASLSEMERLATLRGAQLISPNSDLAFNNLTSLAAFICDSPIALLTLVDDERQWFEAPVGFDMGLLPREHAFCQFALHAPDLCEVPDATADARFAHNPLVTGDAHLRFCVSVPLHMPDGQPLGTLCAFDTKPCQLSDAQQHALRLLARQVTAHLELRRARLQLEHEHQQFEGLLRMSNSAGDTAPGHSRPEIFVKQEQRLLRVSTVDIQHVEALGDYVNIHTAHERLTVYGTMKDLETKLPGRDFARVHRKYIVRLDCICTIEADVLLLDGGPAASPTRSPVRVPIGSSYKAGLLGRLNLV